MKVTHREKEVINLIAQELTTKEIAAQLYISNSTVTSHRKNAMEKLKAKNTAGLISKCYREGILRIFTSLVFIMTFSLNSVIGQDEPSIGLEVDTAFDVVFGTPLTEEEGSHFHWSPGKSALRAGFYFNDLWIGDNIGECSTAFGCENSAKGPGSMTWGNFTYANAWYSSVWGTYNSTSYGANRATVWGHQNSAHGVGSTIWGEDNFAAAQLSTIWGEDNEAHGVNSTVWGSLNNGYADGSTVFGISNDARGNYSTVMGFGNIAKGFGSLVLGQFCDTLLQTDQSAMNDDTPLLIVGNGSLLGRSNALSVFGNGRMKLGKGTASADIHIHQSETGPAGGSGGIMLQHTSNDSYWQIYYSGDNLSFMKDGTRRAYINPQGEFIDAIDPAQRITKDNEDPRESLREVIIGNTFTPNKLSKVVLDESTFVTSNPSMIIYDESKDPIGIDYKQLYLTAIAALQEEIKVNKKQQTEIDALKEIVYNR